jgi:hypothetical protein
MGTVSPCEGMTSPRSDSMSLHEGMVVPRMGKVEIRVKSVKSG